jgi:alginate O-acetyltransferase complex protein AlgI
MLFQSPQFAAFFAIVVLLTVVCRHRTLRHAVLLLASYTFYSAWDPRFLSLLVLSTVVDFVAGRRLAATTDPAARKRWLLVSLVVNLGILGAFKYFGFFTDAAANLAGWFGLDLPRTSLEIVLPIGISFYTFQTMSYTLDIYRGRLQPEPSLLRFALYVAFFPQLVAGPIVRARTFLPQLRTDRPPRLANLPAGALLFAVGLFKKIVIADHMASVVDPVFSTPELYGTAALWFAALAYAVQIYCDFSGYSDMAIGIGRILGYRLPRNFDRPYSSCSPRELWTRWHISLSSWLRDYLYIPLGGNRRGSVRTHWNLMVTMLLGGLWHGANWTFVLWGFLHGAALSVHRAFRGGASTGAPRLLSRTAMFGFLLLTWVVFRAESIPAALGMLSQMLSVSHGREALEVSRVGFLSALMLLVAVEQADLSVRLEQRVRRAPPALKMYAAGLLVAMSYSLSAGANRAFIYFQF